MIRIKRYSLLQKKLPVCAVAVFLLLATSACAGTRSLSKVDQYVVEACEITWSTEGDDKGSTEGDDKGKWIAPSMENAKGAQPWDARTSPISAIIEIRDEWQRLIVPATTAAQLDSAFRPLADAIKGMLDTTALIVDLRESNTYFNNFDGYIAYNSQLRTWRTECNATANRLPK